jgi:hypothetical protein
MLWLQNNKDKLFKVTIDLEKPMRGGDMIRCPFDEPQGQEDLPWGSKECKTTQWLYSRNSGFKGINL